MSELEVATATGLWVGHMHFSPLQEWTVKTAAVLSPCRGSINFLTVKLFSGQSSCSCMRV